MRAAACDTTTRAGETELIQEGVIDNYIANPIVRLLTNVKSFAR